MTRFTLRARCSLSSSDRCHLTRLCALALLCYARFQNDEYADGQSIADRPSLDSPARFD
ncbi:MAG: hypothetical protein KME27_00810 [Lyngbya sp. HA4199-MV5]|nr:hypothetical protein [Lyngbya sp. HA4199-MV5]